MRNLDGCGLEKIREIKNMTADELAARAEALRREIIAAVEKNGGHLASNLGAAELILGMHYVFDASKDKFIFDVGHQAYAHKILTGRGEKLRESLRKRGGISGFPNPAESPFDAFVAGHSSTSLSLAAGFLRAKKLSGADYEIVVLAGDGAMTGGMMYEALNDLRALGGKAVVILNDNGRPYSGGASGFSAYLTDIKNGLIKKPFKEYGIGYYGPIDGNDTGAVTEALTYAKTAKNGVIIHAVTTKGRGFAAAENDPEGYHGLPRPESEKNAEKCGADARVSCEISDENDGVKSPLFRASYGETRNENCGKNDGAEPSVSCGIYDANNDVNGGLREYGNSREKSFSEVAGESVCELAEHDGRVVAVTAAMKTGTGLSRFAEKYPERFFDAGICEPHAVTMSAALAREGYLPFVAIYSSFLQRGFDGLIHDVGIMNNNVRFLIDRAGLAPEDGETHQGIFDAGFLRLVPNIVILTPKDGAELRAMIRWSALYEGAVAVRYPKASAVNFKEEYRAIARKNECAVQLSAAFDVTERLVPAHGKKTERNGFIDGKFDKKYRVATQKSEIFLTNSENAFELRASGADGAPTGNTIMAPDEFGLCAANAEAAIKSENIIIAAGAVVLREAEKAAKICSELGIETAAVYAARLKPLDTDGLRRLKAARLFVIEDNVRAGGFGSAVAEYFADKTGAPKVHIFSVGDGFPGCGTREELLKSEGLDALSVSEKIARSIKTV
ncbi:MAG: 1-deoxy-D-xylulose-5-phosphate synthase [Clostridiales bacterium]|jgi:1-deoxy-D-xylulose-5-phosphate synthase|nr:1-deoxy-D-xylulose-5-phosphate synthase [Clostridiales bacterium]